MVSAKAIQRAAEELASLRFAPSPSNPGTLRVIGRVLVDKCADDDEVRRVIERICEDCSEWPGPAQFAEMVRQSKNEISGVKRSARGNDPNAFWEPTWEREAREA